MKQDQVRASGILIFSNLAINLTGFLRQIIMAWILGISGHIDLMLLAMIVPAIIQSMIGGGAGEIMVIKRDREGFREGSFEALFILSCMVPVALLGTIYFFSINLLIPFFNLEPENVKLFRELSLIFILNMLPGTFNSVLRPHLYSQGFYRFYAVSSVVSQIAGIAFILIAAGRIGIYAFAFSYLLTGTLNAVWFSFRAGLFLPGLFSKKVWKHESEQLMTLLKRVFSLSIQTLMNHFATFWERSLSVKFLSPGYLSSLNYSKTLAELPNTILMSSVLTTSYIEQAKLNRNSEQEFADYTTRTLSLIIKAGFLLQAIMLALAPAIIILIFRRGRFDNEAVRVTLIIFNILIIGFLPNIIMNFLTRTMYILGEYKKLLLAVFLKFTVQVLIMLVFIKTFDHTIPVALLTAYLCLAVILFYFTGRRVTLPPLRFFMLRLFTISGISVILLTIHSYTIDLYINLPNSLIFLASLPFFIISGIAFFWFLRRNGIAPLINFKQKSSF